MMNKWNDIVITLLDCREKNVSESNYQSRIEEQFKFLGWSIYNGCIETKPVLHVGNANSLIPDMVLKKNGERVLPIEIKEPNNKLKKRQEEQLFSYMRQLDLKVGLYIGESIRLYYNAIDDRENPHLILNVELIPDTVIGELFCELLSYDNFKLIALEQFCNDELKRIRYEKSLREMFTLAFTKDKGCDYIKNLLRQSLMKDCVDVKILDKELSLLNICIEYGTKKEQQRKIENERKGGKKFVKYSLNGGAPLFKTKFVLESLRLFVKKNPQATFNEIEKMFPKEIQGGYGVVKKMEDLQRSVEAGRNIMGRFSSTPGEILKSADGIEFVVCNQWDYHNFPNFVEVLRKLRWRVKEIK